MIRNYFKTAIRNLRRNKSFAIINVAGLSVGIAACLLLFMVIRFETSFDTFHKKKDSIYRVGTHFNSENGDSYNGGVAFPVGPAIRIDFPEIKEVASIYKTNGQVTVLEGDKPVKKLNEEHVFYAEPEFFTMFSFEWLSGNPETALHDPNQVVLTRQTAEKYFGNWQSAPGKTIKYKNKDLFTVSGILKDVPVNSDFPLSMVVPYTALKNTNVRNNLEDWVSTYGDANTFIVLPASLSPETFNARLKAFAKKHKPENYASDVPVVQPLTEIHYDSRFGNYNNHTFSHALVNVLSLIGLFLVGIACVNFINLATAQAVNRAKEVGVRKVLGSSRRGLAFQFLGETTTITLMAVAIAVGIAYAALPFLNNLLETKMTFSFIQDPWLIVFIASVTLVVTFLSGLYPAIILSGFNPVEAIKSRITAKMIGGISLRKALVVVQFAIAHILIIGMLIVVKQMNLFRNTSLGFDKAAIIDVAIPGDSLSRSKIDYIKNTLQANPNIISTSFSFATPSANSNWNSDFRYDHAEKPTKFAANLKWSDADYFKTFNLQFVAGRPYKASDTINELVVNETLLHKLGISNPQEALGKEINFWDGIIVAPIVGVVRDFNTVSLRESIGPVVMGAWKNVSRVLSIKIKPGAEKAVLPVVEKLYNETYPDYVYDYQFLDETIAGFYKQESQLAILYKLFAGIAIFISCLGLYGLISFMAIQRTKEVGIRKVLGATAGNIVYLFSREFTLLILIAFVVAVPVAWYLMHQWLQDFSYRIPIGAGIFVLAILGSVIIAWITVGYRAVRAAFANPVKSLRSE